MNDKVISALSDHPLVGSAAWTDDRSAVVVTSSSAATAVRPTPGALLADHLRHWQQVYEYVYFVGADNHGADLDLSGWRASDTGAPFPREHMLEWIDNAVGLIMQFSPRTVLEIGCGSGLLAHRIQDRVRDYIGLDVAAPVIDRLRQQLPGIRLVQAAAHELSTPAVTAALETVARPDCVVLNSVTQCFPNEEYLTEVVEAAVGLVATGGTVVVGDIRNRACASAYANWLEQATNPGITESQLRERVDERIATDEELLCDPRVFARIATRSSRNIGVRWYAKPLRDDTELTRYRYDIVFTVDTPTAAPGRTTDWAALAGGDAADGLDELTRAPATEPLLVRNIPNALLDPQAPAAVAPAALADAAPTGWSVLLDSADGRLLAVGPAQLGTGLLTDTPGEAAPWCNDPFTAFTRRRLPELLSDHLEQHLTAVPRILVSAKAPAA